LIKASLIYSPGRGKLDFTVPLCADHIRRHPYPPSAVVLDELREERP